VAWDGPPEATDSDVTGDILASRNVVAYLWAAVDRGKLQADEMGFVSVPARIVALQNGKVFFDDKVTISLTLPARPGDSPMSGFQLQREMLALLSTALSTMQKAASEAIEQVSSASVAAIQAANANIEKVSAASLAAIQAANQAANTNIERVSAASLVAIQAANADIEKVSAASMSAIQQVSSAHEKTMERAQEGLDHMSAAVASAIKEVNTAHQKSMEAAQQAIGHMTTASSGAIKDVGAANVKAMEQAHSALTTVSASADKLTGIADKIFEDSRERAAALVQEVRKAAQAQKPASPLSDSVKDIKTAAELVMFFKAATEDKDNGGSKK
jgi:hypothetical protein